MHKFDIICISGTFLNNTYEDNGLNLNGYSLLRTDHRNNSKRGGVCLYYKETLAVKMISIPYLNQSLLCEVTIGSKKCIIGTVYRSPSQILINLSLFYQTSSSYFRIFPIATLI